MRNQDHRHHPAPKILPWLAHKAGINDDRAEQLWRAALRHADHAVGGKPSAAYWQSAMDHLRVLIATESQRQDVASFGWRPWSRNLAGLWSTRVDAIDEMALAPIRALRILGQQTPATRTPLVH